MELEIKSVQSMLDRKKEIAELYEEAFPAVERLELDYLIKKDLENHDINFDIVCDGENIVALVFTVEEENMLFVQYLAVTSKVRGKGYGSYIMDILKKKYSEYILFLEIEEIDEKADNYEQRVKRKKFYERNGFVDSKKRIRKGKNKLEIMVTDLDCNITSALCKKIFRKVAPTFPCLIADFVIHVK